MTVRSVSLESVSPVLTLVQIRNARMRSATLVTNAHEVQGVNFSPVGIVNLLAVRFHSIT